MTPEDIDKQFEVMLSLQKQLQAEKARADKAEEMVALLVEITMHELPHPETCKYMIYDGEEPCSCWINPRIAEAGDIAQAHNKRKCDEIVGKIEAEENSVGPVKGSENRLAFNIGVNFAIDIVKSVLGG